VNGRIKIHPCPILQYYQGWKLRGICRFNPFTAEGDKTDLEMKGNNMPHL
jgi:hypothetical protein